MGTLIAAGRWICIQQQNVERRNVAWTFHTHAAFKGGGGGSFLPTRRLSAGLLHCVVVGVSF